MKRDDFLSQATTGTYVFAQSGQLGTVTEKDKVKRWFIEPLEKMEKDDAFVCLMVCFPLIETILRYELKIPDEKIAIFSDGSDELKWFAEFMTIPNAESREVWDAMRNGLLHRAMIDGTLAYSLTGYSGRPARPAAVINGRTEIYVWDLRNKVLDKLRKYHRKLWASGKDCPTFT